MRITEELRRGFDVKVNGEPVRVHQIDNDVNGNSRYVVHFIALGIKREDYADPALTRRLNATPYRAKWYAGGYVLSSVSLSEDLEWAQATVKKWYEAR